MSFEPHNLLVTGGAGFIGTNFVRYWLARPGVGRVIVLDALTYAGNPVNLEGLERDPRYGFVRGDICDEACVREVMRAQRIDTVVHFAAESHVDRSIFGPDDFIRTNVVGTHTLLKVAKALWLEERRVPAHRLHHVPTDEVYGPPGPTDTTFTNCSNNYGPYQFPEKLIPLIIVNILRGKSLPVYGDGRQVRDWLYVEDHCRAIDLALRHGRSGEVYNIGGASETANIDLVRLLCGLVDGRMREDGELRTAYPAAPVVQAMPSTSLIQHVRDRPGHDRRYAIDFTKAREQLGYSPSRNLEQGIAATLDWYLRQRAWWQA